MSRNDEVFANGSGLIPGGVSSPARAFGAVGGHPVLADRGEGPLLYDLDGRTYIDYIQGFGAVILGHAHPAVTQAVVAAAGRGGAVGLSTETEVRLASLIVEAVGSVDRVRFVTSGTEASMTAARLARAATGRSVIMKFEGCYHGHADAFLAKAGSGVATFSVPQAAGVPEASVADTMILPFNDAAALEDALDRHGDRVAAVFVEPVAANMGVVVPHPDFLERLVAAARRCGALVVFDEIVTGFRLGLRGAQDGKLSPDLTLFGKVIGGGLPIGAVAGGAELLDQLLPAGPVYQAGTFAAHPHSMAAGAAALGCLTDTSFETLARTSSTLAHGLEQAAREAGAAASVSQAQTFFSVFFRPSEPRNLAEAQQSDLEAFGRFHRALRAEGVLIPPSAFEAWFPSLAHTDREIEQTLQAARTAFRAAAT